MTRTSGTGLAGALLLLVALVVVGVPSWGLIRAASEPRVVLAQGADHITLPADTRYGLFFRNPPSRGYSVSCSVSDQGHKVPLVNPGFLSVVNASTTENLNFVFDTGSGHLTVDCHSTAAQISTKPAPGYLPILLGGALAVLLGLGGLVLLLVWAIRLRGPRRPWPNVGAGPHGMPVQ